MTRSSAPPPLPLSPAVAPVQARNSPLRLCGCKSRQALPAASTHDVLPAHCADTATALYFPGWHQYS